MQHHLFRNLDWTHLGGRLGHVLIGAVPNFFLLPSPKHAPRFPGWVQTAITTLNATIAFWPWEQPDQSDKHRDCARTDC